MRRTDWGTLVALAERGEERDPPDYVFSNGRAFYASPAGYPLLADEAESSVEEEEDLV